MSFKQFLSFLLCIILLTTPKIVLADEPVSLPSVIVPTGEKDVGAAISPMKKGEKAPFTGVLLSPVAVATIIAQQHTEASVVKIEVDKAVAESDARCTFKVNEQQATRVADKQVLQAQLDSKTKQLLSVEAALQEKSKGSTISPGVWIGIGAVGGIGFTLLTTFLVSRTTK
jgi:hypothetical protein